MIICPNCKTENRLGAIFCRSCGAKLSLDDLNVQNFEQKTGVVTKEKVDKAKKKRRFIINIIRLALLLLIAFAIYLVFQKPDLPKDIITKGGEEKKFQTKQDYLIKARNDGKDAEAEFTELEINTFATSLVDSPENKGRVKLTGITIDLKQDNEVEIYLDTQILGQHIRLCCFGKVSADDKGLKFVPNGFFAAKVGKLPYPMFLFKYLTKNILSKDKTLNELISAISSIEVTAGSAKYSPIPEEKLNAEQKKVKEKDAEKGKATVKVKKN
jgi:hypothetical protein